ncbi:Endo-beta-1,4-glucanase A-like protein [Hapsidospora chrysogenum ATCC 11550]|uniref:cellulase n=1 Tax=Hapsidospora chrysogenum (strain ATCC 11550 / CBS 779.69 / DSM 880 / IAM 14645 / JCM 23072 / IMI 49137) TaxID=857340 RepID=A0A086TGM2_HAPC1|nr:Endo-beta-1,4-glucanase A-like protein [Hapsidospora chrysogenum ATCC 11550]
MRFTESFIAATAAAGVTGQEFVFTGANQAGAEFGEKNIPGQLDKDYTWPALGEAGMNTFRVAFKMERLVPGELSGPVNETYWEGLQTTVDYITGKGYYAVLDPHNYGRYYEQVITDVEGFGAWWTTVATRFADNELVIFDTNNEYHDMENSLVRDLNQAAIDAIRAANATSQYIFVEGNSWSGAWTWVESGNGETLVDLSDPEDKIIYEMHQYLDEDGSGTHAECVSGTIGSERVKEATKWLRDNGKKGIIGETAGANNAVCIEAVTGELQYLLDNADVWTGWLWWAAGPWWANYMFSIEPSSGVVYAEMLEDLQPFIGA